MNPPPQQPFNPEVIDSSWSDEQIIRLLHEYTLGWSHLPGNVLTDLDPFQHSPDNLPEGVWYLVDTDVAKESAYGFWVLETDPSEIQSGPIISGWTTTWNYMKFSKDFEATKWSMQIYNLQISEYYFGLVPTMLCRVFQSGEQNEEPEPEPAQMVPVADEPEPAQMVPVAENEPEPEQVVPVAENEAEAAPVQEAEDDMVVVPEFFVWDNGGFLELDDLEIPLSPDSSCISCLTDESLDSQDDLEAADVQAIDGDAGSDADTSGSDAESSESDGDSDIEVED